MFSFAKQTNPKPVKQEVKGTVILSPLVFPELAPELSVGGDGTDGERDEDGGKRFHRLPGKFNNITKCGSLVYTLAYS